MFTGHIAGCEGHQKISLLLKLFGSLAGGSDDKESACNARDPGPIPGLGRSPGEGNGYPLQYSSLENSMDRGAWRAIIVHGFTLSLSKVFDPQELSGVQPQYRGDRLGLIPRKP